jgi:predicted lipoprotein with Yx(FWY)xxD motif
VKRNTLMIGVAAGFAVLVAACGGGSGSSASSTPRTTTKTAPKTAVAAAPSTTAPAVPATIKLGATRLGSVVVDANGMTLYELDKDSATMATCTGSCASIWLPVMPSAGATPVAGTGLDSAKIGLVSGANGQQVEYGGHPLYRFVNDKAPGDVNGEGFAGGIWWAVGADGSRVTGTTTASPVPATVAPATMPQPTMGSGRGY